MWLTTTYIVCCESSCFQANHESWALIRDVFHSVLYHCLLTLILRQPSRHFPFFMILFLTAIDNTINMFTDKTTSSSVPKLFICQNNVSWNITSMGKCVPETIHDIKWQYQKYMYGNRVISNSFYMFNQKKDEVESSAIIKQRKIYRRSSSAIDILGSCRYSLNTEIFLD